MTRQTEQKHYNEQSTKLSTNVLSYKSARALKVESQQDLNARLDELDAEHWRQMKDMQKIVTQMRTDYLNLHGLNVAADAK